MLIRPKRITFRQSFGVQFKYCLHQAIRCCRWRALNHCFFTFTTYSKASSFKYCRIVLVVTGFGKLVFKTDAILLALMRESPLTNLFKWRISRPESFFRRPVCCKLSNRRSVLYFLIGFCTQHLETLSCFEIRIWLRSASCKAATWARIFGWTVFFP